MSPSAAVSREPQRIYRLTSSGASAPRPRPGASSPGHSAGPGWGAEWPGPAVARATRRWTRLTGSLGQVGMARAGGGPGQFGEWPGLAMAQSRPRSAWATRSGPGRGASGPGRRWPGPQREWPGPVGGLGRPVGGLGRLNPVWKNPSGRILVY